MVYTELSRRKSLRISDTEYITTVTNIIFSLTLNVKETNWLCYKKCNYNQITITRTVNWIEGSNIPLLNIYKIHVINVCIQISF